jgi:hypothetical protein
MRIVSNFMEKFNEYVSAFCALGNILVSKKVKNSKDPECMEASF